MAVRRARNGAVSIAYEDLGGAGGNPLLLVMGLGVSRFWWPQGLVDELIRRGFHVVAYDQRDSGQSSHFDDADAGHPLAGLLRRLPAAYTAEDMADDGAAVLDALGWPSAYLFGHSLGGQLVQRMALRHPDRVRGIAVSAALPSDVGSLGSLRYVRLGFVARMSRLRFPDGPDGDLVAGVTLARAVSSPGYPFEEEAARSVVERERAAGVRSGVRDARAQSRQTGAHWSGPGLATLRVPAVVLHGEADQVLRPGASRATAAAVGGAKLVTFPGVGHSLPRAIWPRVADEVAGLRERG